MTTWEAVLSLENILVCIRSGDIDMTKPEERSTAHRIVRDVRRIVEALCVEAERACLRGRMRQDGLEAKEESKARYREFLPDVSPN